MDRIARSLLRWVVQCPVPWVAMLLASSSSLFAAPALAQSSTFDVWAALFESDQVSDRVSAVRGLATLEGDPRAQLLLERALEDRSLEVRVHAARTRVHATSHSDRVLDLLVEAAADPKLRFLVVEDLAGLPENEKDCIDRALEAATPDAAFLAAALEGSLLLRGSHWPPIWTEAVLEAFQSIDREQPERPFDQLALALCFGPERNAQLPLLLEWAGSVSWENNYVYAFLRGQALQGRLGAEEVLPYLTNENADIRSAALQLAISASGEAQVPADLRRSLLADPDDRVREWAATLAGSTKQDEDLDRLVELATRDPSDSVVCAALRSISNYADPARRALPTLHRLAREGELEARRGPIEAIGTLGGDDLFSLLLVRDLCTDESRLVRAQARQALAQLEPGSGHLRTLDWSAGWVQKGAQALGHGDPWMLVDGGREFLALRLVEAFEQTTEKGVCFEAWYLGEGDPAPTFGEGLLCERRDAFYRARLDSPVFVSAGSLVLGWSYSSADCSWIFVDSDLAMASVESEISFAEAPSILKERAASRR